MKYVQLGKTGLTVSRTSFGVLPLQRTPIDEAVRILRRAYEADINYYDTARAYTDSEEKIGKAFAGMRHKVVIATKSGASDLKTLEEHIKTSLKNLQTDYIDVFQFHNPKALPDDEMYTYVDKLRKAGTIRHIGITFHPRTLAEEAIASGQYETLQYPFSSLSDNSEEELVKLCEKAGIGFVAMKAMAGGLIRNVPANFAWIRRFENVVPIWGIQHMHELEEFLELEEREPALTQEMLDDIEKDRAELSGRFCRGCGYCKPCQADIPLEMACRMDLFLNRAVWQNMVTPEWREHMAKIPNCTGCGACETRCPYGLSPQEMIKYQWSYYQDFINTHTHP